MVLALDLHLEGGHDQDAEGLPPLLPVVPSSSPIIIRLQVSPKLDKRDMLYAGLTYAQRLALKLDATAFYSVSDMYTSDLTTDFIDTAMRVGARFADPLAGGRPRTAPGADQEAPLWRVCDATACAGGNTLSFARSARVSGVAACELDAGRAAALASNLAVAGIPPARVTVHCGDYVQLAVGLQQDIVFVDPPWGGTAYSSKGVLEADELGLSGVGLPALAAATRGRAAALAFSVPRNYDADGLAVAATAQRPGEARHADRLLPFRLDLGPRVLFLCLYPPSQGDAGQHPATPEMGPRSRFAFPTAALDELVAALAGWNDAHGGLHHPRFYDWEKQRWVSLGRWKGMKPVAAIIPGPVPLGPVPAAG